MRILRRNIATPYRNRGRYVLSDASIHNDVINIGPAAPVAPLFRCHGTKFGTFNVPFIQQHRRTGVSTVLIFPKLLQSRGFAQDATRARGSRGPDMRNCRSIEEIAKMAYDHLDVMSPRDMAAFWTLASKHLGNKIRSGREMQAEVLGQQLEKILLNTLDEISDFGYRELAQTTLGLAKIVKIIDNQMKRPQNKILHDCFIGTNSGRKRFIFDELATTSKHVISEFDLRSLSNLIYAFGLAKHELKFEDGSALFAVLALEAIPNLKKFNSQGMSNILWGYANVKASNSDLFREAGDAIDANDNLADFWPQALSNIVWAFATLDEKHNMLFKKVADHVVELDDLGQFHPQALSNIMWAYATAAESHQKLFKKVSAHVIILDNLISFGTQALSNIVWAYATAEESHPKLFKKIADHITALDSLGSFKPQELSNLLWAYATADESHPELFTKVTDHINSFDNLRAFNEQALSNIVWSYATAKESNPKLFKKVADHIVSLDNWRSFTPQALSNTVWAYATADESHPELFKKMADHIIEIDSLNRFGPQALSNIVWAYTTADESHPKLFKKVADQIVSFDNLGAFDAQALSITVWSYAAADETNPKLFKKVADHIIALENLRSFNPQNLSNIVWAYATAQEPNPQLFRKVAPAAIKRQHEFNPQGTANCLWAYATNGQIDKHLFQSWESTASSLLTKCNSQNLSNIAWAHAVENVAAPSLFNADFINACLEKKDDFTLEAICQLHQWQLWQEEMKTNIRFPPSLQNKCHETFISQAPTPSLLQDDVIAELSSIGLHPEEEVLTERGYRLDALVNINGNKVGIDVDGPSHFLGRKPNGSTILKYRQVTNLEGIQLVSVPYWEWNKLWKKRDKKQQYLRDLLGLS